MASEFHYRVREMRKNPTEAERRLWQLLRSRTLQEYKFRRQHPIEEFIADFCCLQKRLIVEVDGEIHKTQAAEDSDRTSLLKERGYEVLRFKNEDVLDRSDDVVTKILNVFDSIRHPVSQKRAGIYSWMNPSPYLRERGRGEGGS